MPSGKVCGALMPRCLLTFMRPETTSMADFLTPCVRQETPQCDRSTDHSIVWYARPVGFSQYLDAHGRDLVTVGAFSMPLCVVVRAVYCDRM